MRRPPSDQVGGSTTSARTSTVTGFPGLVTVPELAENLRTTPKAIYTMVERNQLPGVVRIGRRLLFRRDALLQWLQEKGGAPSPIGDR